MSGDNFGMMEGAYFVGRNELLNWLNDLLQLGYTKVEQTCSGASHCQVMDAIYPGKVPLHKVNFNAKFEYEYVKNYKVLQDLFNKIGIDRFIDVPKLIKGKYQDNLEFLQWIKRYFDLHFAGDKYDAVERRRECKAAYEGDSKPSIGVQEARPAPAKPAAKSEAGLAGGAARVKAKAAPANPPTKVNRDTSKPAPSAGKPAEKPQQAADKIKTIEEEYKTKISELNQQTVKLNLSLDNLEKERDFYFGKLREIEILCQNNANTPLADDILKILYATDGDDFAPATETANE
jgi:RP/EB family microtubule-associated protein